MGNCQAAEAATVVIQHPGNKIERIYWSISAHEVMSSNPGHYVALVITSPTERTHNGSPVRQLKLLRPGDTLLLGQVYRLISFEDVLKEFAAKKCVKLGKLLRESGGLVLDSKKISVDSSAVKNKPKMVNGIPAKMEHETYQHGSSSSSSSGQRSMGRHHGGGGQWKPALQSIAEIGT
ncbi:uncharacterized protein [Solanum tuberosum]|uniref:DUF4228 domain-containing protein n=2 Tax=Solanum TaxID=4107 RepID=M1BXG7_SOLTU|nr:PREDICTED: uncharacterized protein LOC102589633 [Solanum tuberosum]KAH0700411.1 hypothetical protein KY284_014626 [Solanum tuberosum]KAH0719473.1 hypothetical protein KY285_015504 [Solanum tuberosum]